MSNGIDPAYQPTLVWSNDSLVWDARTLAWAQFVPPPETLGDGVVVKMDRAREARIKADRARGVMAKRGHRRP